MNFSDMFEGFGRKDSKREIELGVEAVNITKQFSQRIEKLAHGGVNDFESFITSKRDYMSKLEGYARRLDLGVEFESLRNNHQSHLFDLEHRLEQRIDSKMGIRQDEVKDLAEKYPKFLEEAQALFALAGRENLAEKS